MFLVKRYNEIKVRYHMTQSILENVYKFIYIYLEKSIYCHDPLKSLLSCFIIIVSSDVIVQLEFQHDSLVDQCCSDTIEQMGPKFDRINL